MSGKPLAQDRPSNRPCAAPELCWVWRPQPRRSPSPRCAWRVGSCRGVSSADPCFQYDRPSAECLGLASGHRRSKTMSAGGVPCLHAGAIDTGTGDAHASGTALRIEHAGVPLLAGNVERGPRWPAVVAVAGEHATDAIAVKRTRRFDAFRSGLAVGAEHARLGWGGGCHEGKKDQDPEEGSHVCPQVSDRPDGRRDGRQTIAIAWDSRVSPQCGLVLRGRPDMGRRYGVFGDDRRLRSATVGSQQDAN